MWGAEYIDNNALKQFIEKLSALREQAISTDYLKAGRAIVQLKGILKQTREYRDINSFLCDDRAHSVEGLPISSYSLLSRTIRHALKEVDSSQDPEKKKNLEALSWVFRADGLKSFLKQVKPGLDEAYKAYLRNFLASGDNGNPVTVAQLTVSKEQLEASKMRAIRDIEALEKDTNVPTFFSDLPNEGKISILKERVSQIDAEIKFYQDLLDAKGNAFMRLFMK